jgi:hypothetical protein
MFKATSLVCAALLGCLTLSAFGGGATDMGCLPPPPPTKDYVKKTVRVEIKGKLDHIRVGGLEPLRDPKDRMPIIDFFDYWQITVGGKTYMLQFSRLEDINELANKLAGKPVIVNGTLEGETVLVTGLKADEDSVKQTTEVEARGQLSAIYLETITPVFGRRDIPITVAWNFTVDGKTYTLRFASPELESLARSLDGKAVVLTGEMKDSTITVKTLKAAQ